MSSVTQAFRTVIVRPGQTVCAELVADWSGPATLVEEYHDNDNDDDNDLDGSNLNLPGRHKSVKLQQNQNRVVLFSGAIPYAAVRAAYECKVKSYSQMFSEKMPLHRTKAYMRYLHNYLKTISER